MEFAGAYLAGGGVASTISKGIIDGEACSNRCRNCWCFGMLGALLAAGIWLMLATMRGWPVSTTHSIVGAVVGVGVAAIGPDAVQWDKLGEIVASWFVSPVLGGFFALLLTLSIRKLILNTEDPDRPGPQVGTFLCVPGWLVGVPGDHHQRASSTSTFTSLLQPKVRSWQSSVGIGLAIVAKFMMNRIKTNETRRQGLPLRQRREAVHSPDGIHRCGHGFRARVE
jgi:phosphate/sulfate permease